MTDVIRSGTCPKCKGRTSRSHCAKPKKHCDWWVCEPCAVIFDRRGHSMPKPKVGA